MVRPLAYHLLVLGAQLGKLILALGGPHVSGQVGAAPETLQDLGVSLLHGLLATALVLENNLHGVALCVASKKGPHGSPLIQTTGLTAYFLSRDAPLNVGQAGNCRIPTTRPVDGTLRTEADQVTLPQRDQNSGGGGRVVRRIV